MAALSGRLAYGAGRAARKAALACALVLPGAAMAEAVTVVALGDSLTAGYGLPQGQGFVPQLQAWLDENGVDAVVENAGVSGDTTAGGLARLDWALSDEADAMIVALGGNDLLRALPVESSRANLDAILTRVADERGLPVLLVGLQAPGNYGPDYQRAFNAMYSDLAEAHGVARFESFLGPLTAEMPIAQARARYLQGDGIHPNAEGVAVIVAAMGPAVADLAARAAGE